MSLEDVAWGVGGEEQRAKGRVRPYINMQALAEERASGGTERWEGFYGALIESMKIHRRELCTPSLSFAERFNKMKAENQPQCLQNGSH